jgi:hypothetical protein
MRFLPPVLAGCLNVVVILAQRATTAAQGFGRTFYANVVVRLALRAIRCNMAGCARMRVGPLLAVQGTAVAEGNVFEALRVFVRLPGCLPEAYRVTLAVLERFGSECRCHPNQILHFNVREVASFTVALFHGIRPAKGACCGFAPAAAGCSPVVTTVLVAAATSAT